MNKFTINTLVMVEHPGLSSAIRSLLNRHERVRVIGEARTIHGAMALTREDRPQVVILSSRFDGMPGAEICRWLRASWPESRVILLTTYADTGAAREAADMGASALLLNPSSARLVNVIEAVAAGEAFLPVGLLPQTSSAHSSLSSQAS